MSARRGVLVFVILLGVVGSFVLFIALASRRSLPPLAGSNLLVMDVPADLAESAPPASPYSLDFVRPQRATLWDLVRGLDHAAADSRIAGLMLHIDGMDWGWAKVEEVRNAVQRFRASGKPVYASLSGPGELEYLLASAAGTIATPPLSVLQLDGLALSAVFMRGTFDKLEISPNFASVGQYKSAVESYTQSGMSDPARAALEALLDDHYRLLLDSLGAARGMPADSVARLLEDGPYDPAAALALGLIDTVLYRPELDSLAAQSDGRRKLPHLSFNRYLDGLSERRSGPRIALVIASGTITSGKSRRSARLGEIMGSETLVKTLGDVARRGSIKAVVLRIDSPGGDAQAADEIWRAVRLCAEHKPVIASLSDYAASGGYYIAVAAESIVTQPSTLTGSIGVYGGKLNILGLYRKLGLNVETISRGRHALMLSPFHDFTPEEAARFRARMERTYETFVGHVADGRGMGRAEVDSVAQGRVWTGRAAQPIGLADDFGGIDRALEMARARAGIGADQTIHVEVYPKVERTLIQRVFDDLLGGGEDDAVAKLPAIVRAWIAAAEVPTGAALALMPYGIEIR